MDVLWDAVPHPAWRRWFISQGFRPALQIPVIPAVERPARYAQPIQGLLSWQMGALNEADDLKLF
jgi:hypothetical protein